MVKNLLLLSSVAFGVSFSLSVLVNRDIKTAFFTGLITVPATFSGVVAVNRKQRSQQKRTLTALQIEIHRLKKWETQLNQSLLALADEKQRTEVNLNFLKTELSQLYIQTSEQRSYKQQLSQDLITLSERRRQLEAELHDLQTQIQNCEQRRENLDQSLRSIKAEKQNAEAGFNFMPAELKQLQLQIAERQNQEPRRQMQADAQQFEKLPDEWTEFMRRLPKYELQVLKAIAEQGNPSATIKKIAEKNITMPELLIDFINKRALNTIGDLIIEPGNESFPPIIIEEYLTNVKKVLKIK